MSKQYHSRAYIQKKKMKTLIQKYTCTHVHSSTIYNSEDMAATQMPINRQLDKEDMVYIYTTEYYSALKKE